MGSSTFATFSVELEGRPYVRVVWRERAGMVRDQLVPLRLWLALHGQMYAALERGVAQGFGDDVLAGQVRQVAVGGGVALSEVAAEEMVARFRRGLGHG